MQWFLEGFGSARFVWGVENDRIEISTTYLGDGLASIVGMAIDLALGAGATFATLGGEPGGYRIFCSGATDEVFVQVVGFKWLALPDKWWQDATLKWRGRVPVADVVNCIRGMAAEVLETYGIDGYRERWGMPFPLERYQKLQQLGAT